MAIDRYGTKGWNACSLQNRKRGEVRCLLRRCVFSAVEGGKLFRVKRNNSYALDAVTVTPNNEQKKYPEHAVAFDTRLWRCSSCPAVAFFGKALDHTLGCGGQGKLDLEDSKEARDLFWEEYNK